MPLFVFKNNAEKSGNNYLKVALKGTKTNPYAIGAKIKVTTSFRGIISRSTTCMVQSSMEVISTIGIGKDSLVNLTVQWPLESQRN